MTHLDARVIDLWDIGTFNSPLLALLETEADLIRNYLQTDQKIFLDFDHSDNPNRPMLRPDNPYAYAFSALEEAIGREMEQRTIRAFHYTRMTDNEVGILRSEGIHLSTPATLERRLGDIVDAGLLSRDIADQIVAESPFVIDEQLRARADKFYLASHPVVIDNPGVKPLLKYWGGEVASMYIRDKELAARLALWGKPRIIEVAVPMRATTKYHPHSAGCAAIASFARSRGSITSSHAFDVAVNKPLPATAILAVHTEGDPPFAQMGREYPPDFVDVDLGYWKELTGED